jgi:hypothetical protein
MSKELSTSNRVFTVCRPGHEKTNPELADLLMAFGLASWTWTHTESLLFLLFAHVVEPNANDHTKALRAAYFSVVSPLGRLDMINAAISATGDENRIDLWKPLYLDCRTQQKKRGNLAHLAGYSYKPANRKDRRAILMEPTLHPNTKMTHERANSVEYTADYLRDLTTKWQALAERIYLFTAYVDEKDSLSESARSIARLLSTHPDPSSPTRPEPPAQPPASQE